MKKKRFSVEQIVAVVKQAELRVPVAEVTRKVGISERTFYRWKKQYVGMETDQARQMKQLQEENRWSIIYATSIGRASGTPVGFF
jgi:putative transposase